MNLNLIDVIKQCPDLNITVKVGDLMEAVDYCVQKTKQELQQQITEANTETYPTPDEVAKILGVDRSTLWRWHKKGYLCHNEVGGKRKYRMSDINKLLEKKSL